MTGQGAVLNETHDPGLSSWVSSANLPETDFPVQNLPFGIFRTKGAAERFRGGVAIGDRILDIPACLELGLFDGRAREAAEACRQPALNALMGQGPGQWSELRAALSRLLRDDGPADVLHEALVAMDAAEMSLPADIGDYTDFFSSRNHATNIGKLFRPDNPLLPNYRHIPIAYHGRASSVRPSGTPACRPVGQLKPEGSEIPVFAPCARLDYEIELGFFVGAGNPLGSPIRLDEAEGHIFGFCILNDWSARDIQAWEYQPLGPFLAKSFATTISPWVVTTEALAPFRTEAHQREPGDPEPLPYLSSPANEKSGGLDIVLEVAVTTAAMRGDGLAPHVLGKPVFKEMYWTVFQMVAHHTSNGCNLNPGDLIASGTVSGSQDDQLGSLMEVTRGGRRQIELPGGETRTFLEDGDEIVMRARCRRHGFAGIGFGECRSRITPAGTG